MFDHNRRVMIAAVLGGPLLCAGMVLLTYFGAAAWHLIALLSPACVMVIVICLAVPTESSGRTSADVPQRKSVRRPRAGRGSGFPAVRRDEGDADEESVLGRWRGLARLWPASHVGCPRIIPVEVFLAREASGAHLLETSVLAEGGRVVGVDVVEYDRETGNLDLGVTVAPCGGGRPEHHIAILVRKRGRLVSEDSCDRFTLELRRIAT